MAKYSIVFSSCSLLMAGMFAYSASVQLNDPDWYFWFPLYACASFVNLVNWTIFSKTTIIRQTAKMAIWLGVLMFLKVATEDFASRKAGFLSLDLRERLVREKTGSGLVIISMILHLEAFSEPKQSMSRKGKRVPRCVEYGMAILVTFSFGLPFVFLVVRGGKMKFDQISDKQT